MAALALLVVTLYLLMRKKPWYVAGIPMVGMLATTITAMVSNAKTFLADGKWLLFGVGTFLLVLAVWLVIEAAIAVVRFRKDGHVIESLDIEI